MNDFRTGDLARIPISAVTIAACSGIYVYQRVQGTDLSKVWFSYDQIVAKKEVWRIISSTYTHGSLIHLLMNMFTTFQEGMQFEAKIGPIRFLSYIMFLVVLAGLITLAVSALLKRFGYERFANMPAVGYSGVLFGIFALESLVDPFAIVKLFYFIPVWFCVVPFIYLVGMQILVPNVSFIGHASGIAAGYLTHYLYINTWVDGYVLSVVIALVSIVSAYSYMKTRERGSLQRWELPSYSSSSGRGNGGGGGGGGKARIVNGVLIRD